VKKFLRLIVRLVECCFVWRVKNSTHQENLKDSTVILALSFGVGLDSPGKSNKALAEIVRDLYNQHKLPIIVQKEIVSCLPGPLCEEGVRAIIREPRRVREKYLDTREILEQCKSLCSDNQYADLDMKAILVAHPHHLWRTKRMAEKLGFVIHVANTKSVPYDRRSRQWWTRNQLFYFLREVPTRIVYLIRGWI